ncbi:MAG: protein kinase [Phycisphaerales bacterium]|nr:protein kinase [Phycisphaerales bacterium]
MNAQTYQRVKSAFLSALEREDDAGARLDEACGDDRAVRLHVERLLAAHHSTRAPFATRAGAAHEPPADLPKTIGPYRILGILGQGGMGTVYRAEQPLPQRQVALKVIRSSLLSPDSIRRFLLEIHALGSLRHPGVATIFDAGITADQVPYFAMELVDGLPLIAHARAQRLDLARRAELISKVAEALQHAHERGVIHSDLKPGNILVEASGQPRILDFGIAILLNPAPQPGLPCPPGHTVGTPPYMSPEQLSSGPVDHRSDLYSLGIIADRLLADEPQPRRARRRLIPPADARLRADVSRIVQHLLALLPENRPASAAQVASLLNTALASHRNRRARRLARWSLAAAITVIAATILFAWLRPTPAPFDFNSPEARHAALVKPLLPGESKEVDWKTNNRPLLKREVERLRGLIENPGPGLDTWNFRWGLICTLWRLGDLPAAETAARETLTLAMNQDNSGPRLLSAVHLGTFLTETGRASEAADIYDRVDTFRGRGGWRNTAPVGRFLAARARTLHSMGRSAEARELLIQAEATLNEALENSHPLLVQVREDLARFPAPDPAPSLTNSPAPGPAPN